MRLILAILAAACLLAPALPARADDGLDYRLFAKDVRENEILIFLKEQGLFTIGLPFKIADPDLNDDGVPEWVIRQDKTSGCESRGDCEYLVIALKDKKPFVLAKINAIRIGVLDDTVFGVKKLAVYNDLSNDYKYITYAWTPEKYTFLPL